MTHHGFGAEKLVRDKMPGIIRETGAVPLIRVADDAEYVQLLRVKLLEEVGEFLEGEAPEELADILEVVLALASHAGLKSWELEELRAAKAEARGGFGERFVWRGNQSPER